MASDKQIKNQKELNALQSLTMSMTSDMSKAMDDIIASTDKRNKKLQEDATITKKILSDLKETGDVNKAIARVNTQIGQSKNKEYGINEKQKLSYQAQLEAIKGIASGQKEAARLSVAVADVTDEVANKFRSGLDSIDGFVNKIPFIGTALSNAFSPLKEKLNKGIDRASEGMKNGFNRQLSKALANGEGMAGSFKKGITGGINGATKALSGTLGVSTAVAGTLMAVVGIGYLIYKAFGLGLKRFKELDAAAKEFRNSTGLLNSQTGDLKKNIENISMEMAGLGVSASDVAGAAAAFSNEMKGTSMASKGVLTSMVAMEKSFGVSAATQAKVNNTFQLMSGAGDRTAQKMIQTTIAAAELAGVAPAAVMQDIAENAEAGMMHFRGSTKALAKAAIEARRMGTSIGETTKVAEGLLDFESSITKELELGAMLGTRVNFNKARALAFEGDMIGMQKAVNAEVSKLGDINKMNMYQKKALTDATGMDLKSLIKQQQIAKKFKGIDDEKLAAANALLDRGMKINDITEEQLASEAVRLGNQQEMQSKMTSLSNTFKALGLQIKDAFAPMVGPIIEAATMVGKLLMPVFKVLGVVIKAVLSPLNFAMKIIGNIYDLVKALTTDGFGGFLDKVKEMGPLMSGISVTVGIIGLTLVSTLVPALIAGAGSLITMAGAAVGWAISMAAGAIAAIASASAATLGIGALAIAGGIAVAAVAMNSATADAESSIPSVDDGVVKDRQVVSTHPDDFLIATKKPESLFGESMFGKLMSTTPLGMMANSVNDSTDGGISNVVGGISNAMSGIGSMLGTGQESNDEKLISKLDELLIVMKGNKDVYMDGKKVTAGVSNTVDKIGANSYAIV